MARRAFLEPRMNPFIIWLTRLCLPILLRHLYGGIQIEIANEELEKLRQYQGTRMLLLPNHPKGEEPAVLFDIFKRMNENLNCVAAREVFDWEHGFRGWVLRRIGAYSVIRGAADRESFMTTKKILMEGKNRLVIFVEGEISRENDVLIPFEPGVFQLAYWAQEALVKEAKKNQMPDFPPIYAVSVAIKYFYRPGIEVALDRSLTNLEKATGLTAPSSTDLYQRLRVIGEKVLKVQEDTHQMVPLPETTLTQRADAVKSRMLKKIELFLDLKPNPEATLIDRMREIRNTMDRLIHMYDDPIDLTEYEQRVNEHFRLALHEFYQDLDRVACFLTYDEEYLRESHSPERLAEMVVRLEREVFGIAKLMHPRVAVVKVGDIFNLKEHFPEYEADKKGFVQKAALQMENNMMAMLANIQRPKSQK